MKTFGHRRNPHHLPKLDASNRPIWKANESTGTGNHLDRIGFLEAIYDEFVPD